MTCVVVTPIKKENLEGTASVIEDLDSVAQLFLLPKTGGNEMLYRL
jgi:hypothetical protein